MASEENNETKFHRELSLSKEDLIKLVCRASNVDEFKNPIVIIKTSQDNYDLDFDIIKIRFDITEEEYNKQIKYGN